MRVPLYHDRTGICFFSSILFLFACPSCLCIRGITFNILSPSSQEVSLRRSQTSVASTVPELPGLSDKHNLVEESTDDLVQGKCNRQAKCYIHQKQNTISAFWLDNDKCLLKVKSTMRILVLCVMVYYLRAEFFTFHSKMWSFYLARFVFVCRCCCCCISFGRQ